MCLRPGQAIPKALKKASVATLPQGYKTFFMLSSAETKIYPADKC